MYRSNISLRNLESHTRERMFGTDLMTHISRINGWNHIPLESMCNFGPCPETPFKRRIREAVDRMMSRSKALSWNLFGQFVGFDHPTLDRYNTQVREMGFQLNVDGYHEKAFLEFCTTVCLMAILGRRYGVPQAPHNAVLVIEDVVQSFKALGAWPDNAWEDLEREAESFQYPEEV